MKVPRSDAKLKNLPEAVRDELYAKLSEPQDDRVCAEYPLGRPWTLDEGRDWLLRTHQVQAGLTAISDWRTWERVRRDIRQTDAEVSELEAWLMNRLPGMTTAEVMDVGNLLFIHRATKDGDFKTFKGAADLILRRDAATRDLEKLRAADKSRIDAGLDALFQEIQGNAKAEALFKELKAAVEEAAKPAKG